MCLCVQFAHLKRWFSLECSPSRSPSAPRMCSWHSASEHLAKRILYHIQVLVLSSTGQQRSTAKAAPPVSVPPSCVTELQRSDPVLPPAEHRDPHTKGLYESHTGSVPLSCTQSQKFHILRNALMWAPTPALGNLLAGSLSRSFMIWNYFEQKSLLI